MKEDANAWFRSTRDSLRSKKGLAMTAMGVLLIIIGAVIPIEYDFYGQPRSFLNNAKALFILVAILLFLVVLSALSLYMQNVRISKYFALGFLFLSILLAIAGTVETVAWTAGVIDKTIDTGLGLYFMYIGTLAILAGSVAVFRESRKLPESA
ncbi:MAG: hypothetical protein H5T73_08720 [Actinobacteria bacterium]|nr:hypothetical protein [Actinomycetota bacterium]